MRLTDRTIAALPIPTDGQKLYSDDSIPGFGVRVGKETKTFVLTTGFDRRRTTLGRYPIVSLAQARGKAKTLLAKRQLGMDYDLTPYFGEACEKYLASRESKVRPSTARHDAMALGRFKPLSRKRVADITPEAVQDIINRIRAPTSRAEAAQRYCNFIRHLIRRGDIAHWPVERLDGRMKPVYRDRVLDRDELATVLRVARRWQGRGHIYGTHGTIVELLILTGQRRQQFGSLERHHVDFENDTITWPSELMKTGKRHAIPFGAMARKLLERRPSGLMFANGFGKPYSFPGTTDRAFRADCGFNGWTLHDLRRTMATYWQQLGIEIATTEKMLSHTAITGGLVGLYQRHSYLEEMRLAVSLWESYIRDLCTPEVQ